MPRGNQGRPIFKDDKDRKRFLQTLEESCQKTGWEIAETERKLNAKDRCHNSRTDPCECAQGAFVSGIHVGRRDEVGAEQVRELVGVNAVVFVFAPVDGFDIKGVGQDEGQAGGFAGIGQPIPAEHAFAAHGQILLIRLDQLEEIAEVVIEDVGVDQLFALAIHHADVHLACVQIDSAVELGRGL